jgi:hypothetical protein
MEGVPGGDRENGMTGALDSMPVDEELSEPRCSRSKMGRKNN